MTEPQEMARIGAVVLAAGQSRRMGSPKMVLPWGQTTIIAHVAATLSEYGIQDIVVVTGGARELVEQALRGHPLRTRYNPRYAQSEMLASLQVGLADLSPTTRAALVVLGDQPFIEGDTIRKIAGMYQDPLPALVVPSYQMRRGHPWLVSRDLWTEILEMPLDQTLRDFLNRHAAEIVYAPVDQPGILKDLDTPEDYQRERP